MKTALGAVVALLLTGGVVWGDMVNWQFSGTVSAVQNSENYLAGSLGAGSTFTGSFSYDNSVPLTNGNYYQPPNTAITINLDGYKFSRTPAATQGSWVTLGDNVNFGGQTRDFFWYRASPFGGGQLVLHNGFATGLYTQAINLTLDTTTNLNAITSPDLKQLTALNLAKFDTINALQVAGSGPQDAGFWEIDGKLTSLTLVNNSAPTPEPGSLTLLLMGSLAVATASLRTAGVRWRASRRRALG
jgi:hypothetical protein